MDVKQCLFVCALLEEKETTTHTAMIRGATIINEQIIGTQMFSTTMAVSMHHGGFGRVTTGISQTFVLASLQPVSYTHLTLPTNREV